jgi:integral membrane protein
MISSFSDSLLFLPPKKIMNDLLATGVGRLRVIAFLEGWSLLLLIFIAMPVKYVMGIPEATFAIGMIHGILFIGFVIATAVISIIQKWTFGRLCMVMASSVLPFGTFYIDRKILRKLTK